MEPQGWFSRDHAAWCRSSQMIRSLVKQTGANILFGHDKEVFYSFKIAPEFYD